jgi:hypothetical protein
VKKSFFLQRFVEKTAPEGAKVGVFAPFRVSRFFCKIRAFEKLFSKEMQAPSVAWRPLADTQMSQRLSHLARFHYLCTLYIGAFSRRDALSARG